MVRIVQEAGKSDRYYSDGVTDGSADEYAKGWYFVDETEQLTGPYKTLALAREAKVKYGEWLAQPAQLDEPEDHNEWRGSTKMDMIMLAIPFASAVVGFAMVSAVWFLVKYLIG